MHIRLALLAAACGVLTAPSMAADMPSPPPLETIRSYNWTGHYIGVHGGFGWGEKRWRGTGSTGIQFDVGHDVKGWLGGVQGGANWQHGNWVFGVEADFSGASLVGSATGPNGTRLEANADWIASATGRLGWASDSMLFYFKGGAAWVHDQFTASRTGVTVSAGAWLSGWSVGGGAEWRFAPHWTLKAEYNYMDFGRNGRFDTVGLGSVPVPPQPPGEWEIGQVLHLAKLGLNYQF